MPLITRENAAEFGRKSAIARKLAKERAEREKQGLPAIPVAAEDQRTRERVKRQIERCDAMLEKCKSPRVFVQLTAAKEKLWNLIYPKAGSIRPSKSRDRAPSFTPIAPLPIEPASPLVVSPPAENHNEQNPDSQVAA